MRAVGDESNGNACTAAGTMYLGVEAVSISAVRSCTLSALALSLSWWAWELAFVQNKIERARANLKCDMQGDDISDNQGSLVIMSIKTWR